MQPVFGKGTEEYVCTLPAFLEFFLVNIEYLLKHCKIVMFIVPSEIYLKLKSRAALSNKDTTSEMYVAPITF